jgi:formamidopyrimidine-DNA glycosylase
MPELPEVETTVKDLKKTVLGRIFVDVWTDTKKIIKKPKKFEDFKKELIGKEILDVKRRGKIP